MPSEEHVNFDSMPTESAPPCPPSLALKAADPHLPALALGETIDDYQVLRLLGSGGFARVYLARQVSLDRLVALKVSCNQGSEARTLARLEHRHIVQVFAETVNPGKNLRYLCMQFIPGVTLDGLIDRLARCPPHSWSGHTFLTILDELCTETTTFDLGGLEEREFLETCDHVELTCWLGARLAEALAHAHSQGVIHRDVKPANILVNRYGRPFLADFNISSNAQGREEIFGGTLAYMAPEHLDAFGPEACGTEGAVDARSDIYSLALVLFKLLTGTLPFAGKFDRNDPSESVRQLARERRVGPPSARAVRPEVPDLMDRLLVRCLLPDPEHRFPSAAAVMHALDGCRVLLQIEKVDSWPGRFLHWCQARPFPMLLLLALVPHLIGSIVNITYNGLLIVDKNPAQQACFGWLVMAYNATIYPLVVLIGLWLLVRTYQGWNRLRRHPDLAAETAAGLRRQVLALPNWVVTLSWLGWFPGALVFPLGLHIWAGPISAGDFSHFLMSVVISGLIASTYAYFGVQWIVLRVLYPQMWSDPAGAHQETRHELSGLPGQLRHYQFLAVLIPLFGAALLIAAGPDKFSLPFRLLVTGFIVLGLAGFALATRVCNYLTKIVGLVTEG